MANEIITAYKPWKYEDSVAVAKPLVATVKKASLDLVRELYAAQKALSNQGVRTDKIKKDNKLTSCQMAISSKTWLGYLAEIGLSPRTAYNWLGLYIPAKDILYSPEEYRKYLEDLFRTVKEHCETDIGWRPKNEWGNLLESRYQKWLKLDDIAQKVLGEQSQQADLFSKEYLDTLVSEVYKAPSQEDIIRLSELTGDYQNIVPKTVKPQDPMRIVLLAEKAAKAMSPADAASVMRSIAYALTDIAEKEGKE
ncbi:MAG: hypothetical protein WC096_00845 [Sphaerochaetaceae bacterium]